MSNEDYSKYQKYVNSLVQFTDGNFRLYTALYGSWQNDAKKVFRVREDNEPQVRAEQKGIRYFDRIVPASEIEVGLWIETHPKHMPIE